MLHNLMFHPPPPPKPPKAPNCNLNSTLQHSGKHMHNQHIGSKIIRNMLFLDV